MDVDGGLEKRKREEEIRARKMQSKGKSGSEGKRQGEGMARKGKDNGKETRWMWMEEWRRRREEKRGFGSYLVRIFRSKQCEPELHTPVPERCSVEERVLVLGPNQNRYNTAAGSARQPRWSRDCSPDNAQRR